MCMFWLGIRSHGCAGAPMPAPHTPPAKCTFEDSRAHYCLRQGILKCIHTYIYWPKSILQDNSLCSIERISNFASVYWNCSSLRRIWLHPTTNNRSNSNTSVKSSENWSKNPNSAHGDWVAIADFMKSHNWSTSEWRFVRFVVCWRYVRFQEASRVERAVWTKNVQIWFNFRIAGARIRKNSFRLLRIIFNL